MWTKIYVLNMSNSGLTNIGKTIFLIIYISNLFETEYIVALATFLKMLLPFFEVTFIINHI